MLFATIAAGGGHVATARAMAEALERYYPGEFETEVSDFMFDLGLLREDRQHKQLWRWALARPQLVRTGQRVLDSAPTLTRRYHRLMLRRFSRAAAARLELRPVDLVVANHGWLTVGLTRARQRHGLRTPILSFATEPLDASALWAEPAAERFVVPSEAARKDLIKLGVGPERIDVVGYPVREQFLRPPGKAEARSRLGIEEGFTCLVSLGGEGIADDPREWISALLAEGIRVVVLSGRNPLLRRKLAPLAASFPHLRLEGYTEAVADFLAASDVVVGKAGPASVFEALAVGRPFIATGYAGLNEVEVVRFLARRGLGMLAKSRRAILEAVTEYRREPIELERVAQKTRELDFAGMSERLAGYIASYAREGRADPLFVGAGLE
ncbi:MAG TPA: glycosyltransferase [Trueperaceae bacterium]